LKFMESRFRKQVIAKRQARIVNDFRHYRGSLGRITLYYRFMICSSQSTGVWTAGPPPFRSENTG
jgi:hypothetical protein